MRRLPLLLIAFVIACGGNASAPTSVSPAAPAPAPMRTGILEGTVTAIDSPIPCPHCGPSVGVIYGAVVEVSTDLEFVARTTTDDTGRYSVTLPPRQYIVRFSKPGYRDTLLSPVINEGYRTVLNAGIVWDRAQGPLPQGSEWNVAGAVTDRNGQPIVFATVSVPDHESHPMYASTSTDSSGQFRLRSSVVPAPGANVITISRTGYVTEHLPFACCSASEVTVNVRMRRVVSVTLSGPASLVVTEAAPVIATVELDDGTRTVMNPMLLVVGPGTNVRNSPRGSGFIEGVAPGTARVSWSYYGVSGDFTVTVKPG
jgi:hypothetical protein